MVDESKSTSNQYLSLTVSFVVLKLEQISHISLRGNFLAGVSNEESLAHLRVEHRDLDTVINFLVENGHPDQDLTRRLKRRKLNLRDRITRLEHAVAVSAGS